MVGKPCSPSSSSGGAHVDLLHAAARRQDVARREGVEARDADACGVEAGAVLEAAGGPHPAEVPPVAHAPAVVALADAVELDGLVADEDLAVDVARDLVAGTGLYIQDGFIQVTDKPGLGIELNPDVVRAHLAPGEVWWG